MDPSLASAPPTSVPRPKKQPVVEVVDEVYSPDESAVVVTSAADHLITEMFPGAEEVR